MENKTKVTVACGIMVLFALIVISFSLSYRCQPSDFPGVRDAVSIENPILTSAAPQSSPGADDICYILREYDGQIAVFVPGSEAIPIQLTGIMTKSLRILDQEKLRAGIFVEGKENLAKLLEDFGS